MVIIEIVSKVDISSPEEAYAYLQKLKSIIQYTGVSDVRMEEGSLRADANISIRPVGEETFGTKTELKNLNSFAFVRDGIAEEAKRQDRKSTRLNSSHVAISYAVFCLKKK